MGRKLWIVGTILAGLTVIVVGLLSTGKPESMPDPELKAMLEPAFSSEDIRSPFTVFRVENFWNKGWRIEFQPLKAAKLNHGRKEVLLLPLAVAGFRANKAAPDLDYIEIRSTNQDEDVVEAKAPMKDIRKFISGQQNLDDFARSVSFKVAPWCPDASSKEELVRQYIDRGEILSNNAGLHAQSLALFNKAHDLAPNDARVLYCLGRSHWQAGDSQKAIQFLEAAIQADPQDFKAYPTLAAIYIEQKRPEAAAPLLQSFERVRTGKNASADTYYKWALIRAGHSYGQLNQLAKAQELLGECIRLYPDEPYPEYLMGRISWSLKDTRGAAAHFKRFTAIDNQCATEEMKAGQFFVQTKDYPSAIRAFRKSYTLGCRDAALFLGLSYAYTVTNRYFDAKHVLKEGFRHFPNDTDMEKNFRYAHWNIVKKRLRPNGPPTPIELTEG